MHPDSEGSQARDWRDATRGLVLTSATATAAADPPRANTSVSIALTGSALSNELLLADTGTIALTSPDDDASSYPMSVTPIPLDMLSGRPAIRVRVHDVTALVRMRLVVELTARNPRTADTAVMRCGFDSVVLDAQTPLVFLDFQPRQDDCSPG